MGVEASFANLFLHMGRVTDSVIESTHVIVKNVVKPTVRIIVRIAAQVLEDALTTRK